MSAEPTSEGKTASPLGLGLRLVGLAVLVALAFAMRDRVADALGVLAGADPGRFALAFGLYAFGLFASALRAHLWLRAWQMPSGTRALFADVLAATALNALTISGAGEAYRIQAITRRGARTMDAALAVFGDRLLGLAVFALAAGVGLVFMGATWVGLSLPGLALVPVAVAGLGFVGIGLAVFPGLRARVVARLRERRLPMPTLIAAAMLSLVTLAAWIGSVVGLAGALGLDVPTSAVAASAPLVAVAAFLPITVGGIGVREAGYALLLAPVGLSTAGGIALGLAQYACFLGVAALGGIVLIARSSGGAGAPRRSTPDATLTR